MKYQQIRDKANRLIATEIQNGDITDIRDNQGNKKGSYNERSDRTTDNAGKFVGRGNQLLRLLD
jgi:hypothetical protein